MSPEERLNKFDEAMEEVSSASGLEWGEGSMSHLFARFLNEEADPLTFDRFEKFLSERPRKNSKCTRRPRKRKRRKTKRMTREPRLQGRVAANNEDFYLASYRP